MSQRPKRQRPHLSHQPQPVTESAGCSELTEETESAEKTERHQAIRQTDQGAEEIQPKALTHEPRELP